jgi:hypothetical protein
MGYRKMSDFAIEAFDKWARGEEQDFEKMREEMLLCSFGGQSR